jgi:translation initiation factor 1
MSGGKPTPGTPTGLAALAALRSELPAGPRPRPTAPPPLPPKGPARAVVRLERKGRGGKEATVIEKLALAPAALASGGARTSRAALGCGGVVDGEAIVLQGDLRPRLEAVLTKRGVRKVTIAG